MPEPWRRGADGLILTIRLTPRSRLDALEGIERLADGRAVVKARVRAVPEDGAANAALIRLLAKSFDLPASAVSLETGATARLKQVALKGDPAELERRLAGFFSPPRTK
jgi:uncharacterized protein